MLCFFEDGTYTSLKGENSYNTGRFELHKNLLQFLANGEGAKSFEVITGDAGKNGKPGLSVQNKEQGVVLKYLKTTGSPADFHDAPFYPDNNLWRIKPKRAEDSLQKLNRLTNYIKHVALILKAANEEKQPVVSFQFSQGPIKIYNGGIGIHPFALVPESWKAGFYNEADARSAYDIYQNYLRKNNYNGAGTGNWVEDDYTILLSIYADLHQTVAK